MRGKKNPVELPKLNANGKAVFNSLTDLTFEQADAVVMHFQEHKRRLRYNRMRVETVIKSLPAEETEKLLKSALQQVLDTQSH